VEKPIQDRHLIKNRRDSQKSHKPLNCSKEVEMLTAGPGAVNTGWNRKNIVRIKHDNTTKQVKDSRTVFWDTTP
jgi:hypothetical protein